MMRSFRPPRNPASSHDNPPDHRDQHNGQKKIKEEEQRLVEGREYGEVNDGRFRWALTLSLYRTSRGEARV